jgi:hypothetical protein
VIRVLPIVGVPSAPEEAAEPWPIERRLVPAFPLVAVVGAMPEANAAAQVVSFLEAARDASAAPIFLHVRRGERRTIERPPDEPREAQPFFEAGATRVILVEAGPAEAGAALEGAFASLEGARFVVSLGADVPAFIRPHFAVAVDRGASLAGWAPEARAVRDRFDARLPEPRKGWARQVVGALLAP